MLPLSMQDETLMRQTGEAGKGKAGQSCRILSVCLSIFAPTNQDCDHSLSFGLVNHPLPSIFHPASGFSALGDSHVIARAATPPLHHRPTHETAQQPRRSRIPPLLHMLLITYRSLSCDSAPAALDAHHITTSHSKLPGFHLVSFLLHLPCFFPPSTPRAVASFSTLPNHPS